MISSERENTEGMSYTSPAWLYPSSTINYGSELLYICELGKYLSAYDKYVSLKGIPLSEVLEKSEYWDYFRVAVRSGWVRDVNYSQSSIQITPINPINLDGIENIILQFEPVEFDAEDSRRRSEDIDYRWCTPRKTQVVFESQTDFE